MKELELEIRGRLMCTEVVVLTALAHAAELTTDPALFIRQILHNAEHNLRRTRENGEGRDRRRAADFALVNFDHFSNALAAHVDKIQLWIRK